MAEKDTFLFEIVVEQISCFLKNREFLLQCNFGRLIKLDLDDPNELEKPRQKKPKPRRPRLRHRHGYPKAPPEPIPKPTTRQSVLFTAQREQLLKKMQRKPLIFSMWSKTTPRTLLGRSEIKWDKKFYQYLSTISKGYEAKPIVVNVNQYVYDKYRSHRLAWLQMKIMLALDFQKTLTLINNDLRSNTDMFIMRPKANMCEDDYNYTKKIEYSKCYNKANKLVQRYKKYKERDAQHQQAITIGDLKWEGFRNLLKLLTRSQTHISQQTFKLLSKTPSLPNLQAKKTYNLLDYIFYKYDPPLKPPTYYVGFASVGNKSSSGSSTVSVKQNVSQTRLDATSAKLPECGCSLKDKLKNRLRVACDTCGPFPDMPCVQINAASASADPCICHDPGKIADEFHHMMKPPDHRILLDLSPKSCCQITEEVVETAELNLNPSEYSCPCACKCTFGFFKKTTWCNTCGGYELAGQMLDELPRDSFYPCPVFHKVMELRKLKSCDSMFSGSFGGRSAVKKKPVPMPKEEFIKRGRYRKIGIDRPMFKFDYGYIGIPAEIGHDYCYDKDCKKNVPKHMGWLWNSDKVLGMKPRPGYRPGACYKFAVRKYMIAKNPGQVKVKRRREDPSKRKKNAKRPLLIIHKKDGEYEVTMETLKNYQKSRAINQFPYEDKDPLKYIIGRTEEENLARQKRKARLARRLERLQRQYIKSAFTDVCKDICGKTYQQAIGILNDCIEDLVVTEDPKCKCYPADPTFEEMGYSRSCSCSDDSNLSHIESDTDEDEWVIEFTPPIANFEPTFKPIKISTEENCTQYSYLDYRVKKYDRFGNEIPRYFIGPDGKQECSDLGGFYDAEHKWNEINVDGYVCPDKRWIPKYFTAPNGDQVEVIDGKVQFGDKDIIPGVDGYLDPSGKWKYYPVKTDKNDKNKKKKPQQQKTSLNKVKLPTGKGDTVKHGHDDNFGCFGNISAHQLSNMGIMGHGRDKKVLLSALKKMFAIGEDVKIPRRASIPPSNLSKEARKRLQEKEQEYWSELGKCHHRAPSTKGILTVDDRGNKKLFKWPQPPNRRPKERVESLKNRGISVSSLHEPCFQSFIDAETTWYELDRKLDRKHNKNTCEELKRTFDYNL